MELCNGGLTSWAFKLPVIHIYCIEKLGALFLIIYWITSKLNNAWSVKDNWGKNPQMTSFSQHTHYNCSQHVTHFVIGLLPVFYTYIFEPPHRCYCAASFPIFMFLFLFSTLYSLKDQWTKWKWRNCPCNYPLVYIQPRTLALFTSFSLNCYPCVS